MLCHMLDKILNTLLTKAIGPGSHNILEMHHPLYRKTYGLDTKPYYINSLFHLLMIDSKGYGTPMQ